jgi:phosphate uptake regulator
VRATQQRSAIVTGQRIDVHAHSMPEEAIDGALLGRWYERFADHAVTAGHRMVYMVTGQTHPYRGTESRVCFPGALG